MGIVSKEEREFFTELYGRPVSDDEINEMMSRLTEYFELLIRTEAKGGRPKCKLRIIKQSCSAA